MSERSIRVSFRGGLTGRLATFPGSQRWCITYWWQGRERRESTGTTDFAAAKKKLKEKLEHLQAVTRGTEPLVDAQTKRVTVNDLLDALEADLALRKIKSFVATKSHIRAARAAFGERRALALSAEAVDAQIEAWRALGHADATINRRTQLLGQAFVLAHARQRIAAVPRFRKLQERNARSGFLDRDQFDAIVAHLPEPYPDYARLAYTIGWRKGEIRALTAANVDLNAAELRIGDSKNNEGRVIPLKNEDGSPNAVGQIVERRLAARVVGDQMVPWLFHRAGRPIGDFRKAWASACRAAGFPTALFHDLRRSFARDAVDSGMDPHVVCRIGGWKTMAVMNRYNIVDTKRMAAALRRLDDARQAPGSTKVVPLKTAAARSR